MLDEAAQRILFEIVGVLDVVIVGFEFENHRGAAFGALGVRDLVAADAFARPLVRFRFAVFAADDGHAVGDHEAGIEPDAELAYQPLGVVGGLVVVFLEFQRAALGYRAEIAFQLRRAHAYAVVGYGERARRLVRFDTDLEIAGSGGVRQRYEMQLVDRVGRVGYNFAEKYLPVCVNGVDHEVEQTFALGLELFERHNKTSLTCCFRTILLLPAALVNRVGTIWQIPHADNIDIGRRIRYNIWIWTSETNTTKKWPKKLTASCAG